MTPLWLALAVTCAAFAAANVACAVVSWLGWPLARRLTADLSAAGRARVAFAWRLGPTVVSVATAGIVGAAFSVFEPRHGSEAIGLLIPAVAAAGVALGAVGLLRAAGSWVASERLAREWTRQQPSIVLPGSDMPAWAVDADFPLIAMVGVRRPRLVVARTVAERCSADELAAIAAHERGHLAAGDNLRRLWLRSSCDCLSWTGRAGEMTRAWQEATEDAADDHATILGAREVDLASALVTVARLSPGRPVSVLAAGAFFYRGDGIERRVRRLLGGRCAPAAALGRGQTRRRWLRLLPLMATAACAAGLYAGAGRAVYDVTEWFVRSLP